MNFNPVETHHRYENRLYIGSCNKYELINSITDTKTNKELYGAGVRSYSKPIGFVLSLFGVASKVRVGGEEFYVNNKSVSKLVLRLKEVEAEEAKIEPYQDWNMPSSQQIVAKKLQDIYEEHAKTGYDANKVNFLKDKLNAIVHEKHNRLDYAQITRTLLGELEKNYQTPNEKQGK